MLSDQDLTWEERVCMEQRNRLKALIESTNEESDVGVRKSISETINRRNQNDSTRFYNFKERP